MPNATARVFSSSELVPRSATTMNVWSGPALSVRAGTSSELGVGSGVGVEPGVSDSVAVGDGEGVSVSLATTGDPPAIKASARVAEIMAAAKARVCACLRLTTYITTVYVQSWLVGSYSWLQPGGGGDNNAATTRHISRQ